MVEGDIFREVDEELRREQYAKLWDKYGFLVIGAALAIVLGVAGYKFWNYQQLQQARTYGARYTEALNLADTGDKKKAEEALAAIAADGPRGYAQLAQMREAAILAASGETDQAIGVYDELAGSSAVEPIFRGFSRIQAALLRVDKADEAEMKKRIGDLAEGNGPWHQMATELLALSAYRSGNMAEAEKLYDRIVGDPLAAPGVKKRAETMLALITETMVAQPKEEAAKTENGAPDAPAPAAGN